jgi:hypothetical protein
VVPTLIVVALMTPLPLTVTALGEVLATSTSSIVISPPPFTRTSMSETPLTVLRA